MSVAVVRQGHVSYGSNAWQDTATSSVGYSTDDNGVRATEFTLTPSATMRELTLSFESVAVGNKPCWWDTTAPANGRAEPQDTSRTISVVGENEITISGIFPAGVDVTIWVWGKRLFNRWDNVNTASATGKPAGLGHIDEGSAYGDYMAYIDEGEEWGEYLPYEDTGNEWSILS